MAGLLSVSVGRCSAAWQPYWRQLPGEPLRVTCFAIGANRFRHSCRLPVGGQVWARVGHSEVVLWGFDGRTVAIGLAAVFLALGLGAWAGTQVGAWAGALAALASLVPAAVLAVVVERRQRNVALMRKQQEVLRKHAPPKRLGDREGQE
jgi:hypothetical protein